MSIVSFGSTKASSSKATFKFTETRRLLVFSSILLFLGSTLCDENCEWMTISRKISPNPFKICLRENDLITRIIRKDGYWPECRHFLSFWREHQLSDNYTFVDIGANIGSCSLLMAANGIKVSAFEPISSNIFFFQGKY